MMKRYHSTIILGLMVISAVPIAAWLTQWFEAKPALFAVSNTLGDNLLSLFLLASGIFLVSAGGAYVLVRVSFFAAKHGHQRPLRLFHRFAPHLVRRILGSALGTTLALTSTTLAQAALPTSVQQELHLVGQAETQRENQQADSLSEVQELPTPGWTPHAVHIPINRLIISEGKREKKTQQDNQIIVSKGQTLWSIASEQLGKNAAVSEIAKLWPKIYELNAEVIGKNPNLLRLGTVLRLPTDGGTQNEH